MTKPNKYMAGSVPRYLRQTRLGYLPLNCILGSRAQKGNTDENLIFDVVMLPVKDFQRMRSYVGNAPVITPTLKFGSSYEPVFLLKDVKEVIVPKDEPDPENFARNYFLGVFGLVQKTSI